MTNQRLTGAEHVPVRYLALPADQSILVIFCQVLSGVRRQPGSV
jgi:hypothetical protein